MHTRRKFLTNAAAVSGITFLPFTARAGEHGGDSFVSATGEVLIFPITHSSFVMQTPVETIYVDPVGGAGLYADMPAPDLILITHEHGDHYDPPTLQGIVRRNTALVSNPAVFDKMSPVLQELTTAIANGSSAASGSAIIDAIPAYNITPERLNFHPKGRDNGYVVSLDGLRIYISGDTEDIPEMRALENIDVAFVSMNLPFTMDAAAAASAVSEFAPSYVYPYHYRGRDNGTQDPAEFARLVPEDVTVMFGNWYG